MNSYACYPGLRFQPRTARFVTPRHPHFYSTQQTGSSVSNPSANILRKESAYVIELAVPGLGKEDIKIEVNNNELVVSAVEATQESKTNFVRHEFDYKKFKRTFHLHKNANTDALQASFNQGILTIVVPDREPETRKIEIL
jgi:HSP20 family protein